MPNADAEQSSGPNLRSNTRMQLQTHNASNQQVGDNINLVQLQNEILQLRAELEQRQASQQVGNNANLTQLQNEIFQLRTQLEQNQTTTLNNRQAGTSNHFSRIPFPTPPKENIDIWFVQLENWFELNQIVSDEQKFKTVITSVDGQFLVQVHDAAHNPPQANRYNNLKKAIITNFADSEAKKIQKFISGVQLGDRKPSQLLNEMRKLGGNVDENLLRNLWVQRLPSQAKAIVAAAKGTLFELAAVADAVIESLEPGINQISRQESSTSASTNKLTALEKKVDELTKLIANMQTRSRSQSRRKFQHRSQSRDGAGENHTTCWYHREFKADAQKCHKPCDWKDQPSAQKN